MGVSIALLRLFHLRHFPTWGSWSGFGVSTSWPIDGWEDELRKINQILQHYLPKDWIIEGPCFAASGGLVMYAWPKNDPNVKEMIVNSNDKKLTLEEYIKQIKWYLGGAKAER